MPRRLLLMVAAACALAAPSAAGAMGNASVAALQVALRTHGFYVGTVDGVRGVTTVTALTEFQRQRGLVPTGVIGPETRDAFGRYGRPRLGSRPLAEGAVGWDAAALQYLLAWHGFPSATFDGRIGTRTVGAIGRFQRWADLPVTGVAGPVELAALRAPQPRSPIALARPVALPVTDRFGPRGARFHTGIDFPGAAGYPVRAAGAGRVTYAGWHPGGWGYLVGIAHSDGVRTMYAHLARIDVRLGQRVAAGTPIGRIGSSGVSSGPHLHFEVRLRGAAIDPLTALSPTFGINGGRSSATQ